MARRAGPGSLVVWAAPLGRPSRGGWVNENSPPGPQDSDSESEPSGPGVSPPACVGGPFQQSRRHFVGPCHAGHARKSAAARLAGCETASAPCIDPGASAAVDQLRRRRRRLLRPGGVRLLRQPPQRRRGRSAPRPARLALPARPVLLIGAAANPAAVTKSKPGSLLRRPAMSA